MKKEWKILTALLGFIFLLKLIIAQIPHCKPPSGEIFYPWLSSYNYKNSIVCRISSPDGYKRPEVKKGSFSEWLRYLPLKPEGSPVLLYNGKRFYSQEGHFAVVDIDIGGENLQQCADAVIRLRAEYLFSRGRFSEISFNFTNGTSASFLKWARGYRPLIHNNRVRWIKREGRDFSYRNLRRYLRVVFAYAGSYSLARQMKALKPGEKPGIGDVIVEGGFPGHAVIIVDEAVNSETGERLYLIAQSFMPAQSIYILKATNETLSPWYKIRALDQKLITPFWIFDDLQKQMRRF